MNDQLTAQNLKRHVAHKLRIGQIYSGKQFFEGDRIKYLEVSGKNVLRVNVIANIVDKYVQEGEKKFASLTLDDASGQIKTKFFGDAVDKIGDLNQGDTVLVVGLLRSWNDEVYIAPEIMKKKDSRYLLVRKLEVELEQSKVLDKEKIAELKDRIMQMIKEAEGTGGVEIENIILTLKEPPDVINNEIRKLLEDGVVFEPRPGKLRYLG